MGSRMAKNMTTLGEYGGLLYKLHRDRHKLADREERTKVILRFLAFLVLVGFALLNFFL